MQEAPAAHFVRRELLASCGMRRKVNLCRTLREDVYKRQPFKAYYAEAMFRGERPQKGRLRQFHQVGIEWLGAPDPAADAECIIMLMEFYKRCLLYTSRCV